MVNGGDRVAELQVNSDQDFGELSQAVVLLKGQIARLTQGCLAADALISSLLAIREGAADELLIEVRDFLRAAVAYREQKEG